ncbi:hypothetical protein ACGFNU_21720 [Spirillospora sp. NPDC048911]|uniref:hypothetical protein n=1 Tax=Spirillospora sp. NPDC048911 TaxID=3364527 RepID=UPI0037235AC7
MFSPDAAATSGVYSLAHPTGTVESEVVAAGRIRSGYGGIRNGHNAIWITLMQPGVAEPLADLLDAFAAIEPVLDTGKAVAVARAINQAAGVKR